MYSKLVKCAKSSASLLIKGNDQIVCGVGNAAREESV